MAKNLSTAEQKVAMKEEEEKYYLLMRTLIGYKSPSQWISRLFDLQNALIGYGFMAFLEDESSKELAMDFEVVKEFLESLEINKKLLS